MGNSRMKVVFNGTVEKRSGGGCKCKGKTSSSTFVRVKTYILPSGASKTFVVGQTTEVSERDGQFLLSYVYKDANGDTRAVFSRVE